MALKAYLLDIERGLDLWNISIEVGLERLDVYGLSDTSCHVWIWLDITVITCCDGWRWR
jgi:hypothetical protein